MGCAASAPGRMTVPQGGPGQFHQLTLCYVYRLLHLLPKIGGIHETRRAIEMPLIPILSKSDIPQHVYDSTVLYWPLPIIL